MPDSIPPTPLASQLLPPQLLPPMSHSPHRSTPVALSSLRWGWRGAGILVAALCLGSPASLVGLEVEPAQAQSTVAQLARIESWQFDPTSGRLEISTQGATRPSLFVLQNPDRVVLDFPNTRLGLEPQTTPYSGRVESVRAGQMTDTTTRFVLALAPGQSIALNQLQLETANAQRWAVQFLPVGSPNAAPSSVAGSSPTSLLPPPPLSTPQLAPPLLTPPPAPPAPRPAPPLATLPPASLVPPALLTPPFAGGQVQIQSLSSTPDGFLVRTTGPANATVRRVPDPDRIVVDLLNTTLSSALTQRSLTVNQLGVRTLRAGQFEPTVARVVLDVDSTVGDWEARYDAQLGGLKIAPAGGASQASLIPDAPSNYSGPLATIQAVQLLGDQLTISGDGFLFYRSGWDPDSGAYRITVRPARLPNSLPDPGLPPNGPVDRIRFVQETPETVTILVQPVEDFNVVEPNPGQGSRRITLQLQSLDGSPLASPGLSLPGLSSPTIPAQPVPGQVVVAIDPGHGGRDPGAIGVGGIQEKLVNMEIARRVTQRLEAAGYGVIMTRTDDREVLLQPRVDQAVRSNATIFVSIHTNALDRSGVRGIETYYLKPDSESLATTLHRAIVAGSGAPDREVRRARFFVVRETPVGMPSVLLELGYLTNPEEGRLLATPEYQDRLAQAITDGILAYLGNR
ncbi:MAG: N-acetylmuramoyl-L-alanine amidase [Cyanophyceae cyanobacterium]